MKNYIYSILLSTFLLSVIFSACQSHEQNADDAFEEVKEGKRYLKDSTEFYKALVAELKESSSLNKNEPLDAWTIFSLEIEQKIRAHDIKIKKIKGIPNTSVREFKKLTNLEKENNDLRTRMNEYQKEKDSRWAAFKIEMKNNSESIDKELKNISIPDSK